MARSTRPASLNRLAHRSITVGRIGSQTDVEHQLAIASERGEELAQVAASVEQLAVASEQVMVDRQLDGQRRAESHQALAQGRVRTRDDHTVGHDHHPNAARLRTSETHELEERRMNGRLATFELNLEVAARAGAAR